MNFYPPPNVQPPSLNCQHTAGLQPYNSLLGLPTTTYPLQQYDLLLDHASTVWSTAEYNHIPTSAIWPIACQQYDLLLNTTTYQLQQHTYLTMLQ